MWAVLSPFGANKINWYFFINSGTFTLSNLGMFGVDRFDAILPPGQVSCKARFSPLLVHKIPLPSWACVSFFSKIEMMSGGYHGCWSFQAYCCH